MRPFGDLLAVPVLVLASDWTTFDGDPQRTRWAKDEEIGIVDDFRNYDGAVRAGTA